MILRPYQEAAAKFLQGKIKALLESPAGSGKTVILASALKDALRGDDRVAWLANTIEQCGQAERALKTFGIETRAKVFCVASNPDIEFANVLVIDECHHLPARTWKRLLGKINGDCIVWCMSATPFSGDGERDKIWIGWPRHVITREQLIEDGHISRAMVVTLVANSPNEMTQLIDSEAEPVIRHRCSRFSMVSSSEHRRRVIWQFAQKIGIVQNVKRNAEVVRIANKLSDMGRSTILLVGEIEHGEMLASRITDAAVVHSKLGRRIRCEIIERFADGETRTLIATSLADEGLDVPRADSMVLVSGGRSVNKLIQRTGRVLRKFDGKDYGLVYDFYDCQHYFLLSQFKARLKTYHKLGYEIRDVNP